MATILTSTTQTENVMDKELQYQLLKDVKAFNRRMKRSNKHLSPFSWYEDLLEDVYWQDLEEKATPQDEFDED